MVREDDGITPTQRKFELDACRTSKPLDGPLTARYDWLKVRGIGVPRIRSCAVPTIYCA